MKLNIPTKLLPQSTNWERERVRSLAIMSGLEVNSGVSKANYFVTKDFKKYTGTWVYAFIRQSKWSTIQSSKDVAEILEFLWFYGKSNFKLKDYKPITNRPVLSIDEKIDKIAKSIYDKCTRKNLGYPVKTSDFVRTIAECIAEEVVWDKPTNVFAKNYKFSMTGWLIKYVLKITDNLMYNWIRTIDNPITQTGWETTLNVKYGVYQHMFHWINNNYEPENISFLEAKHYIPSILEYIEADAITRI